MMENQSQVPGSVSKLDTKTATAIRQGQIVTKISDVVRELVDNSIDAEASSVQILLVNFGIEKVEVKDTGQGIPSSEFKNAVAGGYTSKLKDGNHPSCCKAYGFRGEALSSICSVAKVSITTKTVDELQATKYILDTDGRIESESKVPYGKGTIVVVEKIFNNYPVRKQWIQDKTRRVTELREVENYLKAIAIANPKCHISLYHDGCLVWMKATVPTIDQALITVLGHSLSKNLVRCGPVNVEVEEEEKRKRTLEAFLLKRPIDMRTMSYTSNKFTMIFVNRKRVYVRQFEKLIQQYNAAAVEKPAPADIRRFPVSVVNISIPSNDVDFNRDMDKSKIFLVYKEEISKTLEKVLGQFYGIDLNASSAEAEVPTNSNTCEDKLLSEPAINRDKPEMNNTSIEEACDRIQNIEKPTDTIIPTSPVIPTCNIGEGVGRTATIMEFLQEIPKASTENFSHSPRKDISGLQSSSLQPVKKFTLPSIPSSNVSKPTNEHVGKNCIEEKLGDNNESCKKGGITRNGVSNFDLNLDDFDDSQDNEKQVPKNSGGSRFINDWIHGRITDENGEIIQNVGLVNKPPPAPQPHESMYWGTGPRTVQSPSTSIHESSATSQHNAFNLIRSGFSNTNPSAPTPATPLDFGHPAYKRPRLSLPSNGEHSETHQNPCKTWASGSGKQVTLDSYKNWQTPGGRLSQTPHNTSTGIRIPLSGSSSQKPYSASRKENNPIGIPPKSVRDSWTNSGSNSVRSSSSGLVGMRKSVRMDRSLFSCSQNSSQGYTRSKLIGPISGSNLFAAQVKDVIGAFSPLSMLRVFPSLKYDLNISIEEPKPQEDSTPNPSPKCSGYAVARDDVPKLFSEFLSVVDPSSDDFAKIFHPLHTLKDVQSQDEAQQNLVAFNNCVA